jgi:hypothetical protein
MRLQIALCLLAMLATAVSVPAAELSIAHKDSAGAVKVVLGNTVAASSPIRPSRNAKADRAFTITSAISAPRSPMSGSTPRRRPENVMRNASIDSTTHAIGVAGKHTLKVWMVDPGGVMDKIVIDLGGAKESYLGPLETPAQ